ncbi:hypothetical protein [Paraburkholderia acidisoli]|jgi:hypothetical protein|uniref:hypothetical protein n=1 Tax=Paraburkholderia acidisoli TaxID=2571748 RepID=UPI001E345EF1|nr:hypothetical protein [Paraburkholderia acidisoli]
MDFLRAAGSERVLDAFPDERADVATLASMTVWVGSVEPLPVALLPPAVFAIAIPPLLETWTRPDYPNPSEYPRACPEKTKTNR